MVDRIVIPLSGVGTLVLDVETYRMALAEGAKFAAAGTAQVGATEEALLDADQLAEQLQIPCSWVEAKAREGVIPSIEFGRWRRFRRSEVESAVRATRGQGQAA
jgi:excisionase family DNA binding protein